MKTERPLCVVFFKTDTDNEPVREWLKDLPKEDCKVIGADILTVQFAWPVGKLRLTIWGTEFGKSARGWITASEDFVCDGESGNCPAARLHQGTAKDAAG